MFCDLFNSCCSVVIVQHVVFAVIANVRQLATCQSVMRVELLESDASVPFLVSHLFTPIMVAHVVSFVGAEVMVILCGCGRCGLQLRCFIIKVQISQQVRWT